MSNQITVTGNTSRDGADLRFTPSGAAVVNFRGAFQNSRYDKQMGQYVDAGDPLWLGVVAWREVAEKAAEEIGTGQSVRVTCTGHLEARSFTTKSGEDRTVIELHADTVYVHPPKPRASDNTTGGWGGSRPGPAAGGDPWAATRPGQSRADAWGQPDTDEPPF